MPTQPLKARPEVGDTSNPFGPWMIAQRNRRHPPKLASANGAFRRTQSKINSGEPQAASGQQRNNSSGKHSVAGTPPEGVTAAGSRFLLLANNPEEDLYDDDVWRIGLMAMERSRSMAVERSRDGSTRTQSLVPSMEVERSRDGPMRT